MNRRKVAVFVEGQSEYIFVRDFLCGWYNYDSSLLGIECFSLRSDRYHEQTRERRIDIAINQRFIKERHEQLKKSLQKDLLSYHFAIMEVEAWILGMYQFFQRVDPGLTPHFIMSQLQIDITSDPEISFYHPAKVLADIYHLADRQYDKHLDEISAITSQFSKEDYLSLLDSGKCNSFKEFVEDLVDE